MLLTIAIVLSICVLAPPTAQAQAGPIMPTSCSVSSADQRATVTWVAADNDGANRYVLERQVNGGAWQWTDRINLGEPLSSSVVVDAGDTVIFRIKSRDAADANSGYQTCDRAGVLTAPLGCVFTRSGGTATITWTAADNDGANRYVIERNLTPDANASGWTWEARINLGSPLTHTDTVDAIDAVAYRVKSRNSADDNSTYTDCTELTDGPIAPPTCSVSRSDTTATITWTTVDNDGANRYVIERNVNNTGWFWAARINVGNPLIHLEAIDASANNAFRIKSRNTADDNSSYTACVQSDDDLLAPPTCNSTRSDGAATITWTTATNDGANRYVIERSVNNTGWFWTARINVGNPLTYTDTLDGIDVNDDVVYRMKSRNVADDNSAYITCLRDNEPWVTQALWSFDQTSGPIIDTVGGFDGSTGVGSHPGAVIREPGFAEFTGDDGSIVVVPVSAASADFNPIGGEFEWFVEFSMTQASIDLLLSQTDPAWNLMQRGSDDNPGGQWKIEIIAVNNTPYVLCVIGDNEDTKIGLPAPGEIVADTRHTATCTFDDATNLLQASLDEAVNEWPLGSDFGDVDVVGSETCDGPNALGGSITIGNQPSCEALLYDLALTLSTPALEPDAVINIGDDVIRAVTITNEGAVSSGSYEVIAYLPVDTVLNDPAWTDNGDGTAVLNQTQPLLPGESITYDVVLTATEPNADGILAAEIAADSGDDVDSTPDTVNDDPIEEDDHDRLGIGVWYDLALTLSTPIGINPGPSIEIGDNATRAVTVTNEGNLSSGSYDVIAYLPFGIVLNDPAWTDNGNGTAFLNQTQPLLPGESITYDVALTATEPNADAVLAAEIAADSGYDVDSVPDTVNDDPIEEDDHDQLGIGVNVLYDLALTLTVAPTQNPPIAVGDEVLAEVSVTNEGNVISGDYDVVFYLPAGTGIDHPAWIDNGDGTATLAAIQYLWPGDTVTYPVRLFVTEADPATTAAAEIAFDSGDDIDSVPDTVNNDPIEEDDHDTAPITAGAVDGLVLVAAAVPNHYVLGLIAGDNERFIGTVYTAGVRKRQR